MAIMTGLTSVTVIYLMVNVSYFTVMDAKTMTQSPTVAVVNK